MDGIKQIRLGFKLRTTDIKLGSEALGLYRAGVIDYIELYVVPGTYDSTIFKWKSLEIPVVIHAPHTSHGVNLAVNGLRKSNILVYNEVKKFADTLSSMIIIVHSGCNGTINEVINQLELINEERVCVENKPLKGLRGEICQGSSPREFKKLFDAGVLKGIVLDFGHAVNAAFSLGIHHMKMIEDFMHFDPVLFHLSDGDTASEKDVHLHLGQGNFNIKEFIEIIPKNRFLTLETPRDPSIGVADFLKNVSFLKENLR